jgi:tight adherence protein C
MNGAWISMIGPELASIATFAAILLGVIGFYTLSTNRNAEVRRRLQKNEPVSERRIPPRPGATENEFLVRVVKPLGKLILPEKNWQKSKVLTRLVRAGFRQSQALTIFLGLKILAAVAFPVLFFVLMLLAGESLFMLRREGILLLMLSALFGFFIPDLLLGHITKRRRRSFIEGFPDALDMLVVCVEAGLGLDAAIDRVARELRTTHPAIAAEFGLNILEVRAGTSRTESLRSLAERINVDQVHALVTLLIQAERFGTSIATALRGFAEDMRAERVQTARETAARLPAKLIFPVILFIFPALFLIILGPAFITIMTTMQAAQ